MGKVCLRATILSRLQSHSRFLICLLNFTRFFHCLLFYSQQKIHNYIHSQLPYETEIYKNHNNKKINSNHNYNIIIDGESGNMFYIRGDKWRSSIELGIQEGIQNLYM